jgi:hypothetical protein
MPRKKVVQTELVEQEYQLLQKTAEKRGVTIKHGLREAIQQWISAYTPMSEDPLLKVKPVKTGVKTDSSRLDKLLYEEKRQ